jgi:hypothetical protein
MPRPSLAEFIGLGETTQGSEPSQYLEEQKANAISSVAASERETAQTGVVHEACRRCGTGVAGFQRGPLQRARRVKKSLFSRRPLERAAIEGDEPRRRKARVSLAGAPEYHGTRGTLWESGRTIFQG